MIKLSPDLVDSKTESYTESKQDLSDFTDDGLYHEWRLNGVHIAYVHQPANTTATVNLISNRPSVLILFAISAGCTFQSAEGEEPFPVLAQQHNSLFYPAQSVRVEPDSAGTLELLVISIHPTLLSRYVPSDIPSLMSFRTLVTRNNPARLSNSSLPITPEISAVLYQLVRCQLASCFKPLFIDAKVLELIALQLDQYLQQLDETGKIPVKDEVRARMQEVHNIMVADLAQPFTLRNLARMVGTNEYTLKVQFKQVFNTTVFGYLNRLKMEKAKDLLTDGEPKIAEVAHALGYKHATHFTAAFKKHFGYLPNTIRLGLLTLFNFDPDYVLLLAIG
ncbi:helix-turn-helix transcriptional regulator [Fibrella aquatica]|uniref:helix-turn-helix transcriptional regulator n=1 Tax=Fibrella aquatica TaxID=3242487 RepID=UPI0035215BAD